METRIVTALFALVAWLGACSSIPGAAFRLSLPTAGEIFKIEIACHMSSKTVPPPQSTVASVTDPRRIALVQKELGALSDGWTSWEIVTLPAPEVRLDVTYSSGQRIWFGAANDFSVLWNEKGRRLLSEPERNRLRQLLQRC